MTIAHARAPVLAWLLTALTVLLGGMAVAESRHHLVALPQPERAEALVELAATSAGSSAPLGTPAVTPTPAGDLAVALDNRGIGDLLVPVATGPVILRVTRLIVPPGVVLSPVEAAGWTALLVETGTLSVLVDPPRLTIVIPLLEPVTTTLSAGKRLVVAPGQRYTLSNDGSTLVEALAVTIVTAEDPGVP